jgi:argininosuccinate lyase
MVDPKSPHDTPAGGWSGRFGEPVADRVKRYTASVDFDRRLAAVDIDGSLAHARMLTAVGVLAAADLAAIERGMEAIRGEIERGEFAWSRDLEDVHLNIEHRLTTLVGDAGKRLHTARSRNDQVATDLRLWLRGEIDALTGGLAGLRLALLDLAEPHADTIMPGFTHLQVAQPVTFGHHLLAYDAMLARDMERFGDCRRRVNRLPLGAAALAGTSYPIDRARVAKELGFDGLCPNSLDAVSDRDFAVEFAAAATLVMVHLSRFAEELVLWMSPRFGFIRLADRFCTGSSIMPQKRNPDVPELVRGKSGRVVGHLMGLVTLMKGQPLAYNKDNQEDKEPLFDIVDTLADTLAIMTDLVATGIDVDKARMREAADEGFATATDLADYLVRQGLPFRDAHEAVARAVRHAESKGVDLAQLPLDELRTFAPAAGEDVRAVLTLEGSVASRSHAGGTAPAQVRAAIAAARAELRSGAR